MNLPVPVDGKGLDWPRKVANAINGLTNRVAQIGTGTPGSSSVTFTGTAGGSVSGGLPVYIETDGTIHLVTLAVARLCIGISTNAALIGADVIVQTGGALIGIGSGWTPGLPVYLSASGGMTQTLPTTGPLLQLGLAINATDLNIEISLIAIQP